MKNLISYFKSPKARKGAAAAVLSVVFIAVVILLNLLVGFIEDRTSALSLDVTESRLFTLSEQTKSYIDGLNEDIKITVLIDEEELIASGAYYNQANYIVKQLAQRSSHVSLEYIDYADHPEIAEQFPDVTIDNSTVFVISSEKSYRALSVSDIMETAVNYQTYTQYVTGSKVEQAIISSIAITTSDKLPKAAIITGLDSSGYSPIADLLNSNAYQVELVDLESEDISEDCSFAIIYAPSSDLSDAAVAKLKAFLNSADESAQKSLFYIPYYEKAQTPKLDALIEEYSLAVEDGLMYETNDDYIYTAGNSHVNTVLLNDEVFADNIKDGEGLLLLSPYTRPVTLLTGEPKVLLYGTTESGIYPFSAQEEELDFTYEDGITGNPVVAAAVCSRNYQNVFVFGSSDAFTATALNTSGIDNAAYFLNIFASVSGKEESSVIIESKSLPNEKLSIKYNAAIQALIIVFRWAVPAVMIICAAVIFLRRRKL